MPKNRGEYMNVRPPNSQEGGERPKYSWGAIAVMAVIALTLLSLALCLGAETN